jgi:NAD(P)-dependent dehydrogenase (short-subunit alcohol dehydrogenase family)
MDGLPSREEARMANLENQVVMITGCSSGIGRALAGAFSTSGHRVVATARNIEAVEDLVGDGVLALELDVCDEGTIAAAVGDAMASFGRVDIVVNNAGYALIGPMAELAPEELRKQLETNVVGVVSVTRAVVPQMAERRHGRIVNIGSVSGLTATPFAGAYCGSKAAVHLMSDAMRMELAPFGIRVVTVQPGAIESHFGKRAAENIERFEGGSMYSPVYDAIEARAHASQTGPMPVAEFARCVVDVVTAPNPPSVFRAGTHSVRLPLIGRLPLAIRDRIFSRRFGLERLQ